MSSPAYINYNGNVQDAALPSLSHLNRAFRYGDGVFETIRLMNGEVLYLDKHLARLRRNMTALEMEWHPDFTFQNMHLLIRHLEQVNGLKGNGRIRMEVFREGNGLYTPLSNNVSYLIDVSPLAENEYRLNETGAKADFFTAMPKPLGVLANLKTSNALLQVMAGIHKKKSGLDECIILNTEGNVAEAISSNIFMLKGSEVYTPPLSQGCVQGVMREITIERLKAAGIAVSERKITPDDLLKADEVFTTNVISGIRWLGAIRHKRFFNKFSARLLEMVKTVPAE